MLHWLAGKQPAEAGLDATGIQEPPDTPAPIFAVRAFKHALFGTPQTVQNKSPRRNSNTEHTRPRPRPVDGRPVRPNLARPKSAGDAQNLYLEHDAQLVDAPSSPTKGILLTPGTATAKRKTVTFGAQVQNNDAKRQNKSGIPDDCPGKFPSPWSRTNPGSNPTEDPGQRSRGKSKLTEALEQARDESAKQKARTVWVDREDEAEDIVLEDDDPGVSVDHAKYWKIQFDVYRENSQRELKKLILKQKSAKSFAQQKDIECMELAEQLATEKAKNDALTRRTAELEKQIRELEEQRRGASRASQTMSEDSRREKNSLATLGEPRLSSTRSQMDPATSNLTDGLNRRMQDLRSGVATNPSKREIGAGQTESQDGRLPGTRPNQQSSTHLLREGYQRDASAPQGRPPSSMTQTLLLRATTDTASTVRTSEAPLKSLNLNAVPSNSRSARGITSTSQIHEISSTRDNRRDRSPQRPHLPQYRSLASLQPQHEPQEVKFGNYERTAATRSPRPDAVQISELAPPSSPFEPDGGTFTSMAGMPQDIIPVTVNLKENIAPRPSTSQEVSSKPSAIWMSSQAQPADSRVKSTTVRQGQGISADRLEAARARLQARGRNVS